MRFFLLFLLLAVTAFGYSQSGCTDPKATNYNSSATSNDGSCSYTATNVTLTASKNLPATLNESSALVYSDGGLWTLNDSGNQPKIFQIDESNGSILKTVTVTNASNHDWEEISADANYFYVGDFGNNASGDRTDLKVYRILKTDIGAGANVSVLAQLINFSYPDQVISGPSSGNNTKFDCEAMIVKNNLIHLFTKDWISGHTQHYSVPVTPGTYVATKLDQLDAGGLITGASLSTANQIVLVGYTTNLQDIFMWLLYDYAGDNFFSGNKRRFELGHTIDLGNSANSWGQTEGITFNSLGGGYISSEKLTYGPITVQPHLLSFDIGNYVALPVKLVSFKATFVNPDVKLEWQTASEINSDYFSVQRSDDAVHFIQIGKLNSSRISADLKDYAYADHQPAAGMNYYRLVQVDADGKKTVSVTRPVNVISPGNSLRAYVNDSQLVINAGKSFEHSHDYQLIDSNGSVLSIGKLNSSIQKLNISSLIKGMYYFRLGSETVKFIK